MKSPKVGIRQPQINTDEHRLTDTRHVFASVFIRVYLWRLSFVDFGKEIPNTGTLIEANQS
jgi:hypothetical protein